MVSYLVSAVTDPLSRLWLEFVSAVPGIILAIVILIIGSFVGVILGHALRVILDKTRLDEALRKMRLTKIVGHTDVPSLMGELLKWWIIIIFLQQAVAVLNLGALSVMLDRFVGWLPSLLIAVIIFLLGLAAAHFVQMKVLEHTRLKGMKLAVKILSWIIILLVAVQALEIINIDVSLFKTVIVVVIGALAGGLALALGIGLGLGLRKESESFINNLKKGL